MASSTGNTTDKFLPSVLHRLNTRVATLCYRPGNIGVGGSYNSARVRALRGVIIRVKTSYNVTGSNSTSHYLFISRRKSVVSNSRVVIVGTLHVGGRKQLGTGVIMNAIVDGLNFNGTLTRRKYHAITAGMNSHCILRRVGTRKCSLNNRRSKRVVFPRFGAANSNLVATVRALVILHSRSNPLSRLGRLVAACPRLLGGMGICDGGK